MKHESVISRIISAIFGGKIAVRENLFYDTFKAAIDFLDDDIPNWRAVKAVAVADQEIFIAAGSPYPTPLVKNVDFYSTILRPFVLQVIPGTVATEDTTNGANLITTYVFTDATKTVLASLKVYTTTANGTTVDVDTWVRVI